MEKEKALKRLTALESEAQELRKIIEASEKPFEITDVKTWEDVCLIKKIDPIQSAPFPKTLNDEEKNINSYFMLIKIAEVLNNGWKPNWSDSNERKWYPWFNLGSGFAFSSTFYDDWVTGTDGGSRLCFKDEKTAEYAGKQFLAVYEIFLKK